ncbi:hypothetical protein ACFSUD_12305 [Sulfitobacter aestuarii]|uniref:Uncharacterized protein n=1 Tax=Sulfitobacter aestuarii TaxID=2161676 RepID=A0ABW5U420_9RHOB
MNSRITSIHLTGLSSAVALLMTLGEASAAPQNCAPRETVVTRLAEGYGETRHSVGLGASTGGDVLVEIFASDTTGSWTITMTDPRGQTCMIASGRAFEKLAETLSHETSET